MYAPNTSPRNPVMMVTGILEVEIGTKSGASSSESILVPLRFLSSALNFRSKCKVQSSLRRTRAKPMGRATCISLLFLLLVVVLEIWVFFMETNRRVKALRLHVIAVQELFVCATSWYIWKRVRYVFKSGNSLSISTAVRIACILLLVFAQACIVAGNALVYREPTHLTRISKTCLGVVLFIGTCLAITDVFSLSVRALCCRGNEWREVLSVKTEIKWRTFLALVAAAALTFAGVIGMSQFTVEKLTIPIKGLHPRLNGTTIVQLSDIHLGGFNGRSALQHIVSEVNQLNPDVVVVTGDLVDGPVSSLREIVEPLRDIESKYGVYLATGECGIGGLNGVYSRSVYGNGNGFRQVGCKEQGFYNF